MSPLNAYVSWPSAPLTDSLVRKALATLNQPPNYVQKDQLASCRPLLQWTTYDDLDHELIHFDRTQILSSSYIFRKALIRKHYLSRTVNSYLVKNPDSVLKKSIPRTFEVEVSFADELEEMWTDELWELGDLLDAGSSWWIMKPGMADRGNGIRIFQSKDEITRIFESFDEEEDSEKEDEERNESELNSTAVVTSQLRHFVLQEYIMHPLLLDPKEKLEKEERKDLAGHKFHLRVYCVCQGDLRVYVYTRILALFSSEPYIEPSVQEVVDDEERDLKPHLTNTCLKTDLGEEYVRLLDELEGFQILSGEGKRRFSKEDIDRLVSEVGLVLGETFKAALPNPIHFQPLPNAFELFGVDFLVSDVPGEGLQVKLLELNAEPAIEMTGPRLTWILEDLFEAIAKVCIEPFFDENDQTMREEWKIGEIRNNLFKCCDIKVRSDGPSS